MKKFALFSFAAALTVLASCSSSNGDRAKIGQPDTVGTKTSNNNAVTDSVNSSKDTLKR